VLDRISGSNRSSGSCPSKIGMDLVVGNKAERNTESSQAGWALFKLSTTIEEGKRR
jgi:hypothetical protein